MRPTAIGPPVTRFRYTKPWRSKARAAWSSRRAAARFVRRIRALAGIPTGGPGGSPATHAGRRGPDAPGEAAASRGRRPPRTSGPGWRLGTLTGTRGLPAAPGHLEVAALARALVELAGAGDLLLRVSAHLLPLGEPAAGAWNRKEHREHLDREAQGLVDQPGVEVHVGIQAARHE